MPVPGSPEWVEYVQRLMNEESEQPERLFMLSFADDDGLRGVVITREHGPTRAHRKTHALGINPGGEVMIIEVPPWEVIERCFECVHSRGYNWDRDGEGLMVHASLTIDVEKEPWPDILEKREKGMLIDITDVEDAVLRIGGLTRGTQEGLPTVFIAFDLPDGRTVLAQTTLRLFGVMADTLRAQLLTQIDTHTR